MHAWEALQQSQHLNTDNTSLSNKRRPKEWKRAAAVAHLQLVQ
jgi:hypothetical protein